MHLNAQMIEILELCFPGVLHHNQMNPEINYTWLWVPTTLFCAIVWYTQHQVHDELCLKTPMPEYRLSDMVRGLGQVSDLESAIEAYPNSLVAMYVNTNGSSVQDLVDLAIAQHEQTCVVHLRVGDVLERSERRGGSIAHVLEYGSSYHHPMSFYRAAIRLTSNFTRTTIMAGAHQTYGRSYKYSNMYISAIAKLFEAANSHVTLRLGQDPDSDFWLGSTARCFIAGKGGYARLVADAARVNKNFVVD